MKFTALTVATTRNTVASAAWAPSRVSGAVARQPDVVELHAVEDQERRRRAPGRRAWSARRARRGRRRRRARTPSRPRPARSPASRKTCSPAVRQERQVAGDEVRRHEPAVHREAAEVRDRDLVDVAVADPGDGAEPQRGLAGEHRRAGRSRRPRRGRPSRYSRTAGSLSPRPDLGVAAGATTSLSRSRLQRTAAGGRGRSRRCSRRSSRAPARASAPASSSTRTQSPSISSASSASVAAG